MKTKQTKIRIMTSDVTNPWFNLATEDWIFRELDPDCHTLFLWRNAETVVIGRYQNPWVECHTEKMANDNVYLARRQSGGGAVFHDLGNTNFTFLSPKRDYDQDANFDIIIKALATLGITAELSGRNDLLVDGRKVSGSAFKHAKDRSFHHGTLLVNANMGKLGDYLQPHPLKLQAKGIKSVKSRVANLCEFNATLDHDSICQAIIDSFCQHYGQRVGVEILDKQQLENNPHLNKYYQTMADWDWRFGKTPAFTHQLTTRFDWGIVDLHLNVNHAVVTEATIFSDALDTQFIEALQKQIVGAMYQVGSLTQRLGELGNQQSHWCTFTEDVKQWLIGEMRYTAT